MTESVSLMFLRETVRIRFFKFLKIKKKIIEVQLIYNVLISVVQQSDSLHVCTHPFSFGFFFHKNYHRILGGVPGTI